jgi:hypothetical protein
LLCLLGAQILYKHQALSLITLALPALKLKQAST